MVWPRMPRRAGRSGEDADIEIFVIDETNARVRPDRIAKQIKAAGGHGMVALVGVQSNQFPRAMDLARPLRAAGINVCVGGFHVSGCLAMLPETPDSLKEALDIGVSLFAGEAEGRFDEVIQDAYAGKLKPIYNHLANLPGLEGATLPMLPAERVGRTIGFFSSFDAGRGCPFLCSFCTIINVQGRKSRYRTADDIERVVRTNHAQGIKYFLITDDNLARNRNWESIFDRLIALQKEGLRSRFVIQVDTMCHKIPQLHREGRGGGRQARLHRPREHQSRQPRRREEKAEPYRRLSRDAAGLASRALRQLLRLHPRLSHRHAGVDRARRQDHSARAAARHS